MQREMTSRLATQVVRQQRVLATLASAALLALTLPVTFGFAAGIDLGADFVLYRDAAARWLTGGPFYNPEQLAGAYVIEHGAILYPPVALLLFVPFTLLPAVLWWAVPAGLVAWSLWRLRPRPVAWPIMAALIGFSPLPVLIVAGNPVLWALAFMAAGTAQIGPSILVLLKPSLAPFALFGAWRRRWWIWAVAFGAVCLPFGAMWQDWLTALANSSGPVYYSLRETGLMLIPIVAWAARTPQKTAAE
jgi:hypothetical protein